MVSSKKVKFFRDLQLAIEKYDTSSNRGCDKAIFPEVDALRNVIAKIGGVSTGDAEIGNQFFALMHDGFGMSCHLSYYKLTRHYMAYQLSLSDRMLVC